MDTIELVSGFTFNNIGQYFNLSGQVCTSETDLSWNPEKMPSENMYVLMLCPKVVFDTLKKAGSPPDETVVPTERLM